MNAFRRLWDALAGFAAMLEALTRTGQEANALARDRLGLEEVQSLPAPKVKKPA